MERVVGADVTRGLAVLGMFTAHVGAAGPTLGSPDGWLMVADGRSAATFALLAGFSAALLSGGHRPVHGERLRHARVRVLVRAALLWPVGALMIALGTPVAVILPGYAVMFALTTLAMGLRRRHVLVAAVVVAAVGPLLLQVSRPFLVPATGRPPQLVDVLVGEYYPALVWMAYLLVGLAVGRTDLLAPRAPARLALWGLGAMVVGYGTGLLASATTTRPHRLLAVAPHVDTTPEVVGNIGFTLVVLALALVAARFVPLVVAPLAATGALAFTAYCTHLVAIAALGPQVVREPSNGRLVLFVVVTLVATTAWRAVLGRGPLERLLHAPSTSLADELVPGGRGPLPSDGSGPGEHLPVQDGEPRVLGGAPRPPRLGE